MLLLKLLLLPLKLTAKLLIYSIGTIIILFFFVMTISNGIFSGLIKVIGSFILLMCGFAFISMFFTVGFSLTGFISIVIATGFITLVMFAPDMIQNILNGISGIAFALFNTASFRLF